MNETRFRWVGRPSEEELLGLPAAGTHRRNGFHPSSPPPPRGPSRTAVGAEASRRRLRARDLVAVAVVGGAIGLAFGVAERGLRSESPGPVVPTVAASAVTATVASDRRELASLPRARTSTARAERPPVKGPVAADGDKTSEQPSAGDDSTGSKDDEPTASPPTDTSEPALLKANVPGVGTVTVEQPDLPDTDEVLSGTDTLPLP